MNPGHQGYGDSESLQADVMRFMAIIAFCLIAILALVKNTEAPKAPPATVEEPPAPSPWQEVAATQEAAELPELAPPAVLTPPMLAEAFAENPPLEENPTEPTMDRLQEPIVASVRQDPLPEPIVEPAPRVEAPPAVEVPAARPAMEPSPASTPEPVTATAEASADPMNSAEENSTQTSESEEEGLVLRFASDGDFLRLIARGDIKVYAFQERDVLTLSESYRFLDSNSPGQVYELLLPSIPNLVVDALRQERNNIDGYRWGIALPRHISNQIERHLNRVSRGELVIDRFGDVRHVAAS